MALLLRSKISGLWRVKRRPSGELGGCCGGKTSGKSAETSLATSLFAKATFFRMQIAQVPFLRCIVLEFYPMSSFHLSFNGSLSLSLFFFTIPFLSLFHLTPLPSSSLPPRKGNKGRTSLLQVKSCHFFRTSQLYFKPLLRF